MFVGPPTGLAHDRATLQLMESEEDPNKPFSVARVAVWALGIIALVSVIGLVVIDDSSENARALRSVSMTAIGGLSAVAATRTRV